MPDDNRIHQANIIEWASRITLGVGVVLMAAGKICVSWWPWFVVPSLVWTLFGCVMRRYSMRAVCSSCRANVEGDFMATTAPGQPEICLVCSGEAKKYRRWSKCLPEKATCSKCGIVTHVSLLQFWPPGTKVCHDVRGCEKRSKRKLRAK